LHDALSPEEIGNDRLIARRPEPAPPRLISVAGPIFVELVLAIGVGLVGTWLAARLGDRHAAAFALANNVMAMLFILFRVIGAGIGVVVAQNVGAGDRAGAHRVARAALAASTWMGIAAALTALVFAGPLLRFMQAPVAVLPLAQPFFMALAVGLLLDAWNATTASVLRAHLRVRDTMVTSQVRQLNAKKRGFCATPLELARVYRRCFPKVLWWHVCNN
jgi:Na+-driven multidrug efflux pump